MAAENRRKKTRNQAPNLPNVAEVDIVIGADGERVVVGHQDHHAAQGHEVERPRAVEVDGEFLEARRLADLAERGGCGYEEGRVVLGRPAPCRVQGCPFRVSGAGRGKPAGEGEELGGGGHGAQRTHMRVRAQEQIVADAQRLLRDASPEETLLL